VITSIEATRPFLFFDHFRVPYSVRPGPENEVRFRGSGPSRTLAWATGGRPGEYRLGAMPIFGGVVPGDEAPHGHSAVEAVRDPEGNAVAHVWRDGDGNVFLPFDPSEVIRNFWSEGYHGMSAPSAAARLLKLGKQPYYRLRPLLPRRLQIAMRRRFARVQARSAFPAWPAETALDDFFAFLFGLCGPVPWIAPWPGDKQWAIVLTHDVETSVGYAHMDALCEIERAAGYRSSFNLVPGRYRVDDRDVDALLADGFEVGAHSMRHDGLEFSSRAALDTWLPEMRVHAERWNAVGFRSPSTNRVWEWMPLTGFDYDSSYPDTDPFEPTPGGCCSWLPFFNEQQVELPVTLPQDHLVFVILERGDEALWVEKASFLRERGGMALMIVHPDYMLEEERRAAYRRYLERFADDDAAWRALPREVSAWWRRRAASHVEHTRGGWRIAGPAKREGRIRYGLEPTEERRDRAA
jgi:peptidoglycan/xylan/chitin deacetylase (PgdA/CDA1 family)